MRRRNREVNIFNMSLLDILCGALGAFCFMMLALFPDHLKAKMMREQMKNDYDMESAQARVEEAERIYNALSEGGEIFMALQETFWADRFAMFSDRFGAPWMINVEKPMG